MTEEIRADAHLGPPPTQVALECPKCRERHAFGIDFDSKRLDPRLALEIFARLQHWMGSECPNHFGFLERISWN